MYKIKLDQAHTQMLRVVIPRGRGEECCLYGMYGMYTAMVPTWLPESGCAELLLSFHVYTDTKA